MRFLITGEFVSQLLYLLQVLIYVSLLSFCTLAWTSFLSLLEKAFGLNGTVGEACPTKYFDKVKISVAD